MKEIAKFTKLTPFERFKKI